MEKKITPEFISSQIGHLEPSEIIELIAEFGSQERQSGIDDEREASWGNEDY